MSAAKIFAFITKCDLSWKTWSRNGPEFVAGFKDAVDEKRVIALMASATEVVNWDKIGVYHILAGKVCHRYLDLAAKLPPMVAADAESWVIRDNYNDYAAKFFHLTHEITIPVYKIIEVPECDLTRDALEKSAKKHILSIKARLQGEFFPKPLDDGSSADSKMLKKTRADADLRPPAAKDGKGRRF